MKWSRSTRRSHASSGPASCGATTRPALRASRARWGRTGSRRRGWLQPSSDPTPACAKASALRAMAPRPSCWPSPNGRSNCDRWPVCFPCIRQRRWFEQSPPRPLPAECPAPLERDQLVRRNNTSGFPGVRYQPSRAAGRPGWWIAATYTRGKVLVKAFPIKKHGEEKAKTLAIAERQKQLQQKKRRAKQPAPRAVRFRSPAGSSAPAAPAR